jgi:hypothetical protein
LRSWNDASLYTMSRHLVKVANNDSRYEDVIQYPKIESNVHLMAYQELWKEEFDNWSRPIIDIPFEKD